MLTNDEMFALLKAAKGRSVTDFGRMVEAEVARRASAAGPVCGENAGPVDADLVGCGKGIEKQADVYRCTHCGVPFHRACADRHFADTPELSAQAFEEQIKRLDAKDAPGVEGNANAG
jgi:hypothetical protein